MRLEDIAITLRPRTPSEAIDLGYAMTQHWSRAIFAAWCAVYLPVALLINLLCWKSPVLAVLILWWLKPAFDRVVLYVISGATFGAKPTLRQTLRALPRLWWKNRLLVSLTYGRFDFARSFHLPIIQLEGGRGKALRQRRQVLGREGRGSAVWLTLICLHLEVILALSCYFFVNLFSPGEMIFKFSWQMLFNPEITKTMQYVSNAVTVITISILEPFFVSAGFAIYLNSRTAIEGWDVELAFKKISARIEAERSLALPKSKDVADGVRSTVSTAASTVIAVFFVLTLGASLMYSTASLAQVGQPGQAAKAEQVEQARATTAEEKQIDAAALGSANEANEANEANKISKEDAGGSAKLDPAGPENTAATAAIAATKQTFTPDTGAADAAERIIDSPEFGESKDSWAIKYTGPGSEEKKIEKKQKTPAWVKSLIRFIAESFRVLAWIGIALVVGVLLYMIARYINLNGWVGIGKKRPPDMLFGLDVRPESLPDNVPEAAARLLAAGDVRGATSLLYRAALIALIQDGRIEIGRGDTEGECILRVRSAYAFQKLNSNTNSNADSNAHSGTHSNSHSNTAPPPRAKADYFAALVAQWQRVAYAREVVLPAEIEPLIVEWPSHFQIRRDDSGETKPTTKKTNPALRPEAI